MSRPNETLYLAEQYDAVTGMVYLDRVKIGITRQDPISRMEELSGTKSPVKVRCVRAWLVQNAKAVERYFHRALADVRLEGEWFRERERVEQTVDAYMEFHGEPVEIAQEPPRTPSARGQRSVRNATLSSSKAEMSKDVYEYVQKLPFVTETHLPQQNGSVSGHVLDRYSFYIDPRVHPSPFYQLHLRRLGGGNDEWTARFASPLGGHVKPANRGQQARVIVDAPTLDDVRAALERLTGLDSIS